MPPEGSAKQRIIDDLIDKSKKCLFRTKDWRFVTVINKRKAVTFARNEPSALQPGMTIKTYAVEGNFECDALVVRKHAESDWILYETDVDLEPKILQN